MSHFVTIKTQIKDIEALRTVCTELGFPIEENTEARGIGTLQHGDYVHRLKGPCDIAVQWQADSTFGLSTDWWGGHVEQEVGKNYGRLLQIYAVHKASRGSKTRTHGPAHRASEWRDQTHSRWSLNMKTKTIQIVVQPSGELQIDAVGFSGADCEKATAFLEETLGPVGQ